MMMGLVAEMEEFERIQYRYLYSILEQHYATSRRTTH